MIKLIDLLKEEISASEAYDDVSAIQTIVDGKRSVGFMVFYDQPGEREMQELIQNNNLKLLKVNRPAEPSQRVFVVFRQGAEARAKELRDLAEKYKGYLAWYATPEDTRRIGELLGYKKSDVDEFIRGKQEVGDEAKKERVRRGIE